MKNYSDLTITSELLREWRDSLEKRFDKIARVAGPMSAYRILTEDWRGIGRERGLFLIKKRQQQHNEEQKKMLSFKLRTLAKLQRKKNNEKTAAIKKVN
jgi:hypothetical protein